MSIKSVGLGSLAVLVAVVFGVFALAAGCRKEKPSAQSVERMPAHDHATMDHAQAKTVAGEQTTCPVMGGPINKTIFVEYQGKKVYFCCDGCPDVFKADPAKYIAKLPQFAH